MNNEKNQKIWLEQVHQNLLLRGRSDNTWINYKCALLKFFKFYNFDINLKKLRESDIIDFFNQEYLAINKSKNSYNLAVCSIRLFYLVCFNISLNSLLLPNTKTVKRTPTILEKDKFIEIFNNEKHLKHKCWLLLAFCSGLRVDEVAKIKIEDINCKEHKLKVLGKGNKERYTILPDITIKFLRMYCKEKNINLGYIFKGINDKVVMNSKSIINYFSVIKDTYNLNQNISFHSLRHSFATYYLMNNGKLLSLQSMLGHKSLNSTIIYLHIAQNFNELEGINYV